MPFVLGFAIAAIIEPFVNLMILRAGFKRGMAAFVCLVLLSLIGVSIGRWVAVSLYHETKSFIDAAPGYIAAIQEWIPLQMLNRLEEWLSAQSIQVVMMLPEFIINLLLVFISAFFFCKDRHLIFAFIKKWTPSKVKRYFTPVSVRLKEAGLGFLKSELIVISMVAVISIGAMWITRNPYALLLGIVIAIFDALPIIGAGLILWPWAGYLALTGQYSQSAGLMVLYGIITVIQNVIGPRILSKQIDMHPLAAIMAIFAGIKLLGWIGILLGPAIVLIATVILEERKQCTKLHQT